MSSGGKREGAGRKPLRTTTGINKTIRFTQTEWDEIVIQAYIKEITPSEYIRRMALRILF